MIFVLCANPALDRLLVLDEVVLDEVHRAKDVTVTPGGKGVNVARAIHRAGGKAKLLLFLGGRVGEMMVEGLRAENLDFSFWPLQEETRITTVLHEEKTGRHTVINEPGPVVPLAQAVQCLRFLEEHPGEGDYLVLSGSLPRGLRVDFYAECARRVLRKGVRVVVDTSGEPLRRALQNLPFMVKPNVKEAEGVLGFPIRSFEDKLRAVALFEEKGVECVVLSDGPRGIVASWKGERWSVELKEAVHGGYFIGSGDTLVGVLVLRLSQGAPFAEALRFATACGLANTFSRGAGFFDPAVVPRCLEAVVVKPIP